MHSENNRNNNNVNVSYGKVGSQKGDIWIKLTQVPEDQIKAMKAQ